MIELSIPQNVGALCLGEAATAYARCGFYIAPTRPTDYRNPGSYLGSGWPRRTSRNLAKIENFWTRHPDAGIALHMGRSGAVAADLDVDTPSPDLEPLEHGAVQLSRLGSSLRGHRVFATDEQFVSGKLRLGQTIVGDVRSGNTVIIASPTPHTKGGQYRWITHGRVPTLTPGARAFFALFVEAGAACVDVRAFCGQYTQATRPHKLEALDKLHEKLLTYRSEHDAMREALKVGFGDARIGYIPAAKVVERLRKRWNRDPSEFVRLCQWAAGVATQANVEVLKLRSDRAKGSDSRRYSGKV